MRHPFLRQRPPKSTGREMFGEGFLRKVLAQAAAWRLTPHDVVATLTAFTAESIADAIQRFVVPKVGKVDEVIVSGGGANNPTLMAMLRERLSPIAIRRSDELGINADAKEAIAFAILAHRTVMGLTGNLPSATGASVPVILGSLTLP
jgi:anhydro-N-acetylmuramic acid kinase